MALQDIDTENRFRFRLRCHSDMCSPRTHIPRDAGVFPRTYITEFSHSIQVIVMRVSPSILLPHHLYADFDSG